LRLEVDAETEPQPDSDSDSEPHSDFVPHSIAVLPIDPVLPDPDSDFVSHSDSHSRSDFHFVPDLEG